MSNGSPKTSFLKAFFFSLGSLLCLAILLLLCLPTFFSSNFGKKILTKIVAKKTGMDLSIETLSLSWFGTQSIEGIEAHKKEEELFFTCPTITTDASLMQLIFRKEVGHLKITAPYLHMSKPFHPSAHMRRQSFQTASFATAPVELSLPKLELPITGQIAIEQGKADFTPSGLDPIAFDQIQLSLDLSQQDAMGVTLSGITTQQQNHGEIAVKGTLSHLQTPLPDANVQANLFHLPVRGIDQLSSFFYPQLNGLLLAALGETLDLQCNLVANSGSVLLNLSAKSPLLNAHMGTQTTQGIVSLKNPATVNYTLTPSLLQKLSKTFPILAPLSLAQPVALQGILSEFSCPLPENAQDLLTASFHATSQLTSPLTLLFNGTSFTLKNLSSTIHSPSLQQGITLQMGSALESSQGSGTLAVEGNLQGLGTQAFSGQCDAHITDLTTDILGIFIPSSLPFSILLGPTAEIQCGLALTNGANKLHCSWKSACLTVPAIDLSLGDTWTLITPAPFTYACSPQLMATLFPEGRVTISNSQIFQGEVKSFTLPTQNTANAQLEASLRAQELNFDGSFPMTVENFQMVLTANTLDQIALQINASQLKDPQVALQNLNLPLSVDFKTKSAVAQLSAAITSSANDQGTVQGQFALSSFLSEEKKIDLSHAHIAGTLELKNVPSEFLEPFSKDAPLAALIGPHFSTQCHLLSTPSKQTLSLQWTSPSLSANGAFTIDPSGIHLQSPSPQIRWILTPEGYKALDAWKAGQTKAVVPFEIKEPTTFSLTLSQFSLPTTSETKTSRIPQIALDLNALQFNLTGNNPKLSFYDKSSQEMIQLSALTFALSKGAQQSPINLSLDTSILTQASGGQTDKNGAVSLKGNLETTLDSEGKFDMNRLTTNVDLKVQQMPARVLDLIARAQGRTDFPFTTLFGNLVTANASLHLKDFSGPVSLNLNTPLTRASLAGIVAGGALLLSEPIYAQINVTPEMSRLVLKEVNPLNLSYFYAQDPITLEIPAEGFYLPLYPSNLGKIAIPKATIELGKIFCRNEGNVNITLGLLKSKQFDKNNELMLWFAPIDFHIQQGLVDIERTEILLANTFDVCVWGNIDLLKNYVDMMLGLTAQTLSKAFAIKNLPEKYVLTIPMKGPADNVQINTGKATAKVALLLAWQQKEIAGALGRNPAGIIAGQVLKKLMTLPDSDAKVPPAKRPFPWESATPAKKTSHRPHEKKKHFKQNEKPLKQILKIIK